MAHAAEEIYDVAVVGSGFFGTLTAMILKKLGRSVLLLERGHHPRMAIGESSTPLANLLLEELAVRYDLPQLLPLTKWGSWQRTYPGLACGLKRGFTFYHYTPGCEIKSEPQRMDQLLVAASPRDEIADTHWYRADLDAFLVEEACRMGVVYEDGVRLKGVARHSQVHLLCGMRNEAEVKHKARFVVDASGPRGFLHRSLRIDEAELPGMPPTQALYSHFSNVSSKSTTSSLARAAAPPYPVEDAAVHHVFDGGWFWVLRFNNGVTSAGVAARDRWAGEVMLQDGADAWDRALARVPALAKQFEGAQPLRPLTHVRRLSFRSRQSSGEDWVMLPSAAGFVDPLLSTGFPLALLGIERLAGIFERVLSAGAMADQLTRYEKRTHAELCAASRLIGALYATMGNFEAFAALCLLYFAAASFTETARRLQRPEMASSFLLEDDVRFGPACRLLCKRAHRLRRGRETSDFVRDVLRAIEPFDMAGLTDRRRDHAYPVLVEDLFDNAHKLGANEAEVTAMLRRCGLLADAKDALLQAASE